MSKFLYYTDIDIRAHPSLTSYESDELDFLLSRIITGIHFAIVTECGDSASAQSKIALSFPKAKDGDHGSFVRIFSTDKDAIGRLTRHPDVHRFISGMPISIRETPSSTAFASFYRDRVIDRRSPSSMKRNLDRGRPLEESRRKSKRENIIAFDVSLKSQSTQMIFPFRLIGKFSDCEADGPCNSYGLSRTLALPLF